AADGLNIIAVAGETTGRFIRKSLDSSAIARTPSSVLTINTAAPSNLEYYGLKPVVVGRLIYTLTKGSYGADNSDLSVLDISEIQPSGSLRLLSSTVVSDA